MFESCILTSLLMEVSPMKVHSLGSSRGMLPLTAAYSQLHSSTGMIVVHEREKMSTCGVWQPHVDTSTRVHSAPHTREMSVVDPTHTPCDVGRGPHSHAV